MSEKVIKTMTPSPTREGKEMKEKIYKAIAKRILTHLKDNGALMEDTLSQEVKKDLLSSGYKNENLDITAVILDLEARAEIKREPGNEPKILLL